MSSVVASSTLAGGGLRLLGCRWRIASDDLVIPAWIEFFFRLVGLAVIIAVDVFEKISSNASSACAARQHLGLYLAVAVAIFTFSLLCSLALGLESARGVIWDVNPRTRRWVAPLATVSLIIMAVELVWAIVGSAWVLRGLTERCADHPSGALYAVFAVVIATWTFIGLRVFIWCLSFGSVSRDETKTLVREPRPGTLSRLCSLCLPKSQIDFFRDVSKVLSDVFDDESFVPTDIASALILIYAKQTPQDALNVVDDEPAVILDESPDEEWDNPELVAHFMHYAGAAYGFTWFLLRNNFLNLYKMYPHLRCACCCCCGSKADDEVVEADNCMRCNLAAMKVMLPGLKEEDLIHVSFRNKLAEIPYFVTVDRRYKKIVVSIRGTLSLADTLTDLCARPEKMSTGDGDEHLSGLSAHAGMLRAARHVYRELRSKNLLDKTLSQYDSYGLVVTGHSLGAGTAVLLGFMLRHLYPSVVCYAYSPPGGLLNDVAATKSKEFVRSVIVGQDLVSRLSLHSLVRLKERMKRELLACKLPKYQILASGLTACCIPDWKNSLVDDVEVGSVIRRDSVASADSADSCRPILTASSPRYDSIATINNEAGGVENQDLLLPGRILHLRLSEDRKKLEEISFKSHEEFSEVLISPNMLMDHFPNHVCNVLMMYQSEK